MKLWLKIFIALVLGILVGTLLDVFQFNADWLKLIGDIFLRMINMIIVLLILSSMTVGITSIHDPKKLGRLGAKTVSLFLGTTAISITLGILIAKTLGLGVGMNLQPIQAIMEVESPSVSKMVLDVIPSNPFVSFVEGNVMQIIVFAVFLGISINFAGKRGKPLLEFMESVADVMYRLTSIIMEFSPIGVFAIMAWVTSSFGYSALIELSFFLLTYYFACVVLTVAMFGGILYFLAKLHPWPFLRGMGDAIMVAFSTCSSSATLPVSMHCVQQNLGVSKNISSFVLPLDLPST